MNFDESLDESDSPLADVSDEEIVSEDDVFEDDDNSDAYRDDCELDAERMKLKRDNINCLRDNITYDLSITDQHKYLGFDLTCHVDIDNGFYDRIEERPEVPIMFLEDTGFLPFQTFPIYDPSSDLVNVVRTALNMNVPVGVLRLWNYSGNQNDLIGSVGVFGDVVSFTKGTYFLQAFKAILEGKSCFRVLSFRTGSMNVQFAKVQKLPEESDLCGLLPFGDNAYKTELPGFFLPPELNISGASECFDSNTFASCVLMGKPLPLVASSDVRFWMMELKQKLLETNETFSMSDFSDDPVHFSYWLMANLSISYKLTQRLLAVRHVLERLIILYRYASLATNYYCRHCHSKVFSSSDIICLSQEGASQNFVNQVGCAHTLITSSHVKNVTLSGLPETLHSWFPGYSWTIMLCLRCRRHLGWKFIVTKSDMFPTSFYGLSRSCLNVKRFVKQPVSLTATKAPISTTKTATTASA